MTVPESAVVADARSGCGFPGHFHEARTPVPMMATTTTSETPVGIGNHSWMIIFTPTKASTAAREKRRNRNRWMASARTK